MLLKMLVLRLSLIFLFGSLGVGLFHPVDVTAVPSASAEPVRLETDSCSVAMELPADSDSLYTFRRGIERPARSSKQIRRQVLHYSLTPPRLILKGLLQAASIGAKVATESRLIENYDDLYDTFGLQQKRFSWYPFIWSTSYTRPQGGVNGLLRLKPELDLAFATKYAGRYKWTTTARVHYQNSKKSLFRSLGVAAIVNYDDDRDFYGFGAIPENDARNRFLPSTPHQFGSYEQERAQLEIVAGFRPRSNIALFWTTFLRRRIIYDRTRHTSTMPLGEVFDVNYLPGLRGNYSRHVYHELLLHWDNRQYYGRISPGIRCEVYAGHSQGIDGDPADFWRFGTDGAWYWPVVQDDRVIVARMVMDVMTEEEGISFADYPRHPTFRGVSSRQLLRSDQAVLVPSLEYRWPISIYMGGYLFADGLLVTDDPGDLRVRRMPWAVGIGFSLHTLRSELGTMGFAYGSEGFRLILKLGLSTPESDRTDWK